MSAKDPYTIHALNGGEVSTRFEARQDQNKYLASVAKCENWLPQVLGGLVRRAGTTLVAGTKFGRTRPAVLIPFKFNAEQAYMIEVGHLYMRFFKNGAPIMNGAVPLELVTPYPDTMLRHIKMSAYQSADIMYIPSDGTLPVYKLRRIDDNPDTFDLPAVNFRAPGTVEANLTGTELGNITLTPAAISGVDVVFTASGNVFLDADEGLAIQGPNGAKAIINTVTNQTSVIADIIDPFPDTNPIAATDWSLHGTPSANINPGKVAKGNAITITADADAFRSAYEGKYILVYGGTVEVREVKGPRDLVGTVLSDLIDRDLANPSATGFWLLEENAWNDEEGYPTAGCFYQERNWLMRGQTRWGSNTADFENFAKGNDDSAGLVRTLSDDEINDGLWIKGSVNGLFTATGGGIYQAQASTEKGPLTPNDFNEAPGSELGSAEIAPVRVEGILLYVQDGARNLIEQAFNFVDNKFDSPDLLLRADHLTEFHNLIAMAYQKRRNSTLWFVRDDGIMLALVYRRKEDVVAWAPWRTNGLVKDVAIIPRPEISADWPWIIVDRIVNGATERYIECFEEFYLGIDREWRAAMTDCAIFRTAEIVAGELVVTHLNHVEGKTVRMIGDGMLFKDQVVVNGQALVEPSWAATAGVTLFEVGLDYVSDGLTLEPVIPQERGGPLMARGWVDAGARVRRTLGLKINGERIPFRQANDNMGEHTPLKRGKVVVSVQKCDGEGRISFVQDLPFPAEILNIFGHVSIADEPFPFLADEENPPWQE